MFSIQNSSISPPMGSIFFYTESSNSCLIKEAALSVTTLFLSSMAYLRDLIASEATAFPEMVKSGTIIVLSIATLAIGVTLSIAEAVLRLALVAITSILFLHSLYQRKLDDSFGEVPIMIGITALHSLGNFASSLYLSYEMLTEDSNLDIMTIENESNLINLA